ncbi:MAG: AAA family ATPase, partial [Bacteroidetes bacterium]|nr:AAA family ATPase [Bacteroidota bacterium]
MRIKKINIPETNINNGLEEVNMHRLGHVVLLAGKNGSGKTRLLNLISNTILDKPTTVIFNALSKKIAEEEKKIQQSTESVEELRLKIKQQKRDKNAQMNLRLLNTQLKNQLNAIKSFENLKKGSEAELDWKLIETDGIHDSYTIIPFVPKSIEITDCNSIKKYEIKEYALKLDQVGVNHLSQGTFARIQIVQDHWFNATHQETEFSNLDKEKASKNYNRLKDLIFLFLGTDIGRTIDGEAMIFGFRLGQSNLSDGQRILLQLSLALYCQEKELDNIILFLDEPENHLHPSVIIHIIERIRERTPNGQIWISTHSIPILSYFDPSCIWFVDNNKVSYAGKGPEKVIASLLGDENHIEKLQDFISLPGILAINRYAFESLFQPLSVKTDNSDPQTLQIREEIKKHLSQEDKIRILDFGAGKGRLLANIVEANEQPMSQFCRWFDYVAFDRYPEDKNDCCAVLRKVYSNYDQRYFNDFSDLLSIYDKESFDVVIMCNVLHEIDPNEWALLFGPEGDIPNLLNDNGILLLVEDQVMPIGEKAYQKGFIVLNTADL